MTRIFFYSIGDPWSYEKDENSTNMLLKCNFCHTRIKSKDSMKRHIESVHEGKRPFKCSICPSAFSQRNRLKVLKFEISLCSKLQNRYCQQICNFEDFWTFSMYFDDSFTVEKFFLSDFEIPNSGYNHIALHIPKYTMKCA